MIVSGVVDCLVTTLTRTGSPFAIRVSRPNSIRLKVLLSMVGNWEAGSSGTSFSTQSMK